MAQEESTPVSDESKSLLEDAKKGKPRKFAMICKGTEILSLVVFKKGNVEKHKKEAKQAGKGQFYFGAIQGRGQDLQFVLARDDGFDSAPVKTTVLKKFLEESADCKAKPLFEIVDTAPIVLDEDDPLVARFKKLQEAALAACDAHPDRAGEINTLCRQIGSHFDADQSSQAEEKLGQLEDLLAKLSGGDDPRPALTAELSGLTPQIKQAVTNQPARKDEVLRAVAQVRDDITAGNFPEARTGLAAVRSLLQQLTSGDIPAAPPVAAAATATTAAKLAEALKKLKPLLEQAVVAHPDRKAELIGSMTEVANEIKAAQFESASKKMVGLGRLLQSLVQAPVAPAAGDDPLGAFRARQAELEPQLLAAQRAAPGKATALGAVWSYAEEQAVAGNFVNAEKALAKLTDAIRGVLAAPPEELVAKGTVQAARVLLTTWKDGYAAAKEELGKLRRAVRAVLPNVDADGLVAKVGERLDEFASDLDKAIHEASGEPGEGGPRERARATIATYRKRLSRNRLIQTLSEARTELGTDVNVQGVFMGLFDDLEAALAG